MGNEHQLPVQTGGRPLKWPPEVIEGCLWEVAVHGGNVRKARAAVLERANALVRSSMEDDGELIARPEVPGESTISDWIKGRFKDRYAEMLRVKHAELDEHLAGRATVFAIGIEEAKDAALRQTMAGLGAANGVEASMILRNLTGAQQQSAAIAAGVRNGEALAEEGRGLRELAAALSRFGGVSIKEQKAEIPAAVVVSDDDG